MRFPLLIEAVHHKNNPTHDKHFICLYLKGPGEKHDKLHFANFTGERKNASKRSNMKTAILICNNYCF